MVPGSLAVSPGDGYVQPLQTPLGTSVLETVTLPVPR